MRYQAEPGRGTRGKRMEKSEAEPLEMRYQAEPGNEKRGILFECAQADFVCRASEFYSATSIFGRFSSS